MFAENRLPVAVLAWLAIGASGAVAAAEAGGPAPPDPELLSSIAQRQTELAVLEMDIKKAELQKKLKDLQLSGPLPGPAPSSLPGDFAPTAVKSPDFAPSAYSVQRIHRVGDRLAAVVRFPSGETRSVVVGEKLERNLKVVSVSATEVTVRRADAEPYSLPVVPAVGERR